MRCIAHRGFAGVYPENTIRAVEAAVEAGAGAVEVDVRRCGTGELVVIHDRTVDRVSDATGTVTDLSLDELQSLQVLHSHEGIPTLDSVYETVPAEIAINVELKERSIAGDALDIAERYDNSTLVSSFEEDALREARAAGATSLAYLVARNTGGQIDRARRLATDAIHPRVELCSPTFVEAAHDAELAVNAWTVVSREAASTLARAGVDGLIADAPAYCSAGNVKDSPDSA